MPAAVYDIFERLGGAASFAAQNGDYSASTQMASQAISQSASQQTTGNDDSEAFRPEAWSSGTGAQSDAQPTPGLYRSPDGEASAPSSSPPTHTLRSSGNGGTRAHMYGLGSGMPGVRLGSSPSYGALDQHMRTLELKRGMKRSASGLGRAKTNRVVSAPVGGARPSTSSSGKGSSPLVGMKGSSPLMGMKHSSPPLGLRHSSPLVGLNSVMDGFDPQSLFSGGFQTGAGAQAGANYQSYGDSLPSSQGSTTQTSYPENQTSYAVPEAQPTYSHPGAYGDSQNSYTDAQSAFLDAQGSYNAQDGEEDETEPSQETQEESEATGPPVASSATTSNTAAPKEKGKSRVSGSVPDRTDPNTMPDRNDPNVTIIEDAAALRGMRYEDFEPHMFIGRGALGTEYPRNLEPGAGHERIRCLLCKCGYAGPNGRSMWRRHVSQKHVILLAGKRGTVTKKKEGLREFCFFNMWFGWMLIGLGVGVADEAAVITNYIEKRERTLASKKRYASKKRMDQKLDRLAAQGFDVGKMVTDEAKQLIRDLGGVADEDEEDEGAGTPAEVEEEEPAPPPPPARPTAGRNSSSGKQPTKARSRGEPMPLQDVPPNSSEAPKPKLRLKPLSVPQSTGPENALPPSSPLSPVPTTSVSVSPSEPVHSGPGPTFSFDPPAPLNSYLFSPFDEDVRRSYGVIGGLGKAFGEDGEVGLGKAFGEDMKFGGGGKRVRAFKSTARLDDEVFPILGLSSPLRIGRSRSVGAVESPSRPGAGGDKSGVGEAGSDPETPRTNAAKVAARRLQLFALESPVANATPVRVRPRGALSRSLTTPVMSTALGSHAAFLMGQTPLADGEDELARALGLVPDVGHEQSEDSPVRKRKRGPNTPFPIFPSSKLRESETMVDEYWPSSPFTINTPAPKRARKSEGMEFDSYAGEIIAGGSIFTW